MAKLSKKWAWKLVPSENNEVKTKEYHWCTNHASWTLYTAKECNLNLLAAIPTMTKGTKKPQGSKANDAIALSNAPVSIMEERNKTMKNPTRRMMRHHPWLAMKVAGEWWPI